MTWRSGVQIGLAVKNDPQRHLIERAFGLASFALQAVYPASYASDPAWKELVVPSQEGRRILSHAEPVLKNFQPADVHFALMGSLCHHELLIDVQQTNLDGIRALLDSESRAGKLLWPNRFGRTLYDRFSCDSTWSAKEHLEPTEVQRLLEGTSPGIYQLGSFLSGPFGLLETSESRYAPPTLSVPLYHCSNTGCRQIHEVHLRPPSIPLTEAFKLIEHAALELLGPHSAWAVTLMGLHRGHRWPKGRKYCDMLIFIGDCIVGTERTGLVELALKTAHSENLRKVIGSKNKAHASGTPRDVAQRLTAEEQHQLILLLPDIEIVALLEKAIAAEKIVAPPLEIRTPKQHHVMFHFGDTSCELSSLGLRSTGGTNPIQRLAVTIYSAYVDCQLLNDLDWRTEARGRSSTTALVEYLHRVSPTHAIHQLVLSTERIAQKFAEALDCQLETSNKELLAARLLWKLGFDLPRYDEVLSLLRSRLESFNDTLLSIEAIKSESDRARIRSVGVNLFVSLEAMLDQLVSYVVWLLASDHFIATNFTFDLSEARRRVASVVGEELSADEGSFRWHVEGGNTLGALMRYLAETRRWVSGLVAQDRATLRRPQIDLPHYVEDPYAGFPFHHLQLWADCDRSALERLAEAFAKMAIQLLSANAVGIRNGIDHTRDADEFPELNTMLACVTRLRSALDLADRGRFFPKCYWVQAMSQDHFGRVECTLCDYSGGTLRIVGPPHVRGLPELKLATPFIVAPEELLGVPNTLLFQVRERSVYAEYWQGYPRHQTPAGEASATARDGIVVSDVNESPNS